VTRSYDDGGGSGLLQTNGGTAGASGGGAGAAGSDGIIGLSVILPV
jgi:hypothetical protein